MAQRNTRDVTPDDFDGVDNFDVPTYQPEPTTEAFPASPSAPAHDVTEQLPADVHLGGSTAAPSAPSETVALDREPVYIPPAEPLYDEPVVVADPVVETPAPGRGTIDFGLFLLRLLFGGYLILTSLVTFFRLGGDAGIGGLETAFGSYPYANGLAIMVPTLQLAAGVFIVLGLIMPVAAAVALAVTAFMALHAVVSSGFGWNALQWDADVWLPVILFGIALALQFTGPGLYGVDAGRSWARRPLASSWIWVIVGLALAGAVWWFGTGVNPFVAGV